MTLPALLVHGFERARGSAGSARCVSLCPPPSSGTSLGASSTTTFALPAGTHGCNSACVRAVGETAAARILSKFIGGFAASAPAAASDILRARDGLVGVYNPREGTWEKGRPQWSEQHITKHYAIVFQCGRTVCGAGLDDILWVVLERSKRGG